MPVLAVHKELTPGWFLMTDCGMRSHWTKVGTRFRDCSGGILQQVTIQYYKCKGAQFAE